MDLYNQSCSSSELVAFCPFLLHCKNFKTGHCTQKYQPQFFILAILIGTTDIYHCITLSVTLTLAGGQGPGNAKPAGLFFSHIFSTDQHGIYRDIE